MIYPTARATPIAEPSRITTSCEQGAQRCPRRFQLGTLITPARFQQRSRWLRQRCGIGKPDAGQWTRLGDQLSIGDDPMDSLVASAPPGGLKKLRTEFERALAEGVASVPDAPKPLQDFFASIETPPDWVDPEALRVGQQVLRRGGADGMYIARDVALLGGYQFSGFNQTLLRTGALEKGRTSGSPRPCGGASTSSAKVRSTLSAPGTDPPSMSGSCTPWFAGMSGPLPDWRPDRWGCRSTKPIWRRR